MLSRRLWRFLSASAATILVGQQILVKAVVAQVQDNLNGIPILSPPYPSVYPATWEGYTKDGFETIFPDGETACNSFKTLFEFPLVSPTLEGTKLEYFQEGGKAGEVYQNLCYLKVLNINDGQYYYYDYASRVACPIIALPNRYIYIGDTHGVCVLPYMLEGTGPVEGVVGVWESILADNAYQMIVLWNPQANRYEGYTLQQESPSEATGFKIGDLIWTGTPTGAGTLNESQKWRRMQEGISYEEWRNGSASVSQDQEMLVSSAAGTNFARSNFIDDTDIISGDSGDDVLLGGKGKDILRILKGKNREPEKRERKVNPPKGESRIWQKLQNYKGDIKTNGKSGNDREYYVWDHRHNDIEVYDSKGNHKGVMEPVTGEIYRPPVPGRNIKKEIQ